jgi:hypothetical protein
MKLTCSRVAVLAAVCSIFAGTATLSLAQTAYLPTQPIYSQFASVRTPLEMQSRLGALLQDSKQSVPVVVSTALASGMTPAQVLRAGAVSAPLKLSQVISTLVLASQSGADAYLLIEQIALVSPAQLPLAIRTFAVAKPDLLGSATGAAVLARPQQGLELVSVAMAAAAAQEGGSTTIKAVQADVLQQNPKMAIDVTALALAFASAADADEILQAGVAVAGVPTDPAGALVCPSRAGSAQTAASLCKISSGTQALASTARTQQSVVGRTIEIEIAQVVAQTGPIQGLIGGLVGGGAAAPGLVSPSAVVGTSLLDPNLVSTGTTP